MSENNVHPRKTFGKRRSLRLPGHDYRESRPYHITWGTYERRNLLMSSELAISVIEILKQEIGRTPADLYAYCIMPDHVHVLLAPRDNQDVIRTIQAVKSRTTHTYWELGGTGKLWQRGFYDHILRQHEDIQQVARYILANPVRAGLAEDIVSYPYSGSLVFDKEDL